MHTIIHKDIEQAAGLLKAGEIVAIPTETVYGLAANALNASAVAKIFEAKNRPYFDPLIVHISDISQTLSRLKPFKLMYDVIGNFFFTL